MRLIQIDQERCRRDGICVETCPLQIIAQADENEFPALRPGGETLCIHCGHCVAVCPHGALEHGDLPGDNFPPLDREKMPTADQVRLFMRSRRSIRTYKPDPLTRETLAAMIDLARYAPSGHNGQPVRWTVIQNAEEVRQMAGLVIGWMQDLIARKDPLAAALHMDLVVKAWTHGHDRVCRDAPHLIVASAAKADRTGPAAVTIALTYLELAAHSLGLGACWAGYFNAAANFWPPLQEQLALAPGAIPLGAMMVGYPRHRYPRLVPRRSPTITWR